VSARLAQSVHTHAHTHKGMRPMADHGTVIYDGDWLIATTYAHTEETDAS
jgi:hypothetical protein